MKSAGGTKVTKLTVSRKSEGKAVTSPQGDQDLRRGGLADSKIAQRWFVFARLCMSKPLMKSPWKFLEHRGNGPFLQIITKQTSIRT